MSFVGNRTLNVKNNPEKGRTQEVPPPLFANRGGGTSRILPHVKCCMILPLNSFILLYVNVDNHPKHILNVLALWAAPSHSTTPYIRNAYYSQSLLGCGSYWSAWMMPCKSRRSVLQSSITWCCWRRRRPRERIMPMRHSTSGQELLLLTASCFLRILRSSIQLIQCL